MLVPNRHGSSSAYRYGFQGQERDDELKGEGNSLNYKFRMHDPRVGRFFAVDPLEFKYPFFSPYQFSANTPIMAVELEGLESSNDPNVSQNQDFGSKADMYGNGDYMQTRDFANNVTGMAMQIELPAVEVTGQIKSKSSSWTSEATNGQFTNTQSIESYESQYGKDAAKNYSAKDYANFFKSATRDRWTEEQVAGFSSNFKAGHQNWKKGGVASFWLDATAYGTGGALAVTFAAPAMGSQLSRTWAFNMISNTIGQTIGQSGDIRKVNWIEVGGSAFNGFAPIIIENTFSLSQKGGFETVGSVKEFSEKTFISLGGQFIGNKIDLPESLFPNSSTREIYNQAKDAFLESIETGLQGLQD